MNFEIAIPSPLKQTFTYSSDKSIEPGSRVLVHFGRRETIGVVVGQTTEIKGEFKIKPIKRMIDEGPIYSPKLMALAKWMSEYYLHPIGEVLRTMLPASSAKIKKQNIKLTAKGLAALNSGEDEGALKALFGKRKTLTRTTFLKKIKANDFDEKYLSRKGWTAVEKDTITSARKQQDGDNEQLELPPKPPQHELTKEQGLAFERIITEGLHAEGDKKPFVLHGVTGSGKTEVYIRLMYEILTQSNEGQCLLLVPEISLTPQMTKIFETQFPGQVAVVHSAMYDTERWEKLNLIRTGKRRILIGPRSAVFSAFPALKLIVVDEEHDSSYKQTTGLNYNGRDVAVYRAKLESATVVLGSATPSLETYNNAKNDRYHLLPMRQRANRKPLPEVHLVDSQRNVRKGPAFTANKKLKNLDDELPVADEIISSIHDTLKAGEQAIILVNRRGYAYYLFSLNERQAVLCPHCSVSMTLHHYNQKLHCHYCDHKAVVEDIVNASPEDCFVAIGYGSEKAETMLQSKFPQAKIARLDSDIAAQKGALNDILGKFRDGQLDILVGTQILAKGHDYPNVTLICILEVDQTLGLPDFRAGERTFQLIVQAAGRSGRAKKPGRVLIQSLRNSSPVIKAAMAQDYERFVEFELAFRKSCRYPPFARIIYIELNSAERKTLSATCDRIETWLEKLSENPPEWLAEIEIKGPAIPPIETIRNRHRRSLVLLGSNINSLNHFAKLFLANFENTKGDLRIRVDVDPQSML